MPGCDHARMQTCSTSVCCPHRCNRHSNHRINAGAHSFHVSPRPPLLSFSGCQEAKSSLVDHRERRQQHPRQGQRPQQQHNGPSFRPHLEEEVEASKRQKKTKQQSRAGTHSGKRARCAPDRSHRQRSLSPPPPPPSSFTTHLGPTSLFSVRTLSPSRTLLYVYTYV